MQTPEGKLEPIKGDVFDEMESKMREELTGKPHPIFEIGEEFTIKGGKWRITGFRGNRMFLKAVRY